MVRAVSLDQRGVVEVVAGIEPHAVGQPGAEGFLVRLVEKRDLDSVDLGRMLADQPQHQVRGRVDVARAPVARQRGVEHVAQPVQDHRILRLRQQPAVEPRVIVRAGAHRGQGARGHDDDLSARGLDRLHLVHVGGGDGVEIAQRVGRHVVGARAAGHARAQRVRLCLGHRAADQLGRGVPVHAHAALRGVHRLGKAQPLVPQPDAEAQRGVPVDRRLPAPGITLGQRVRHDVRGGEGRAGEGPAGRTRHQRVALRCVRFQPAVKGGKSQHRGASSFMGRSKASRPSTPPSVAATSRAPARTWSG